MAAAIAKALLRLLSAKPSEPRLRSSSTRDRSEFSRISPQYVADRRLRRERAGVAGNGSGWAVPGPRASTPCRNSREIVLLSRCYYPNPGSAISGEFAKRNGNRSM